MAKLDQIWITNSDIRTQWLTQPVAVIGPNLGQLNYYISSTSVIFQYFIQPVLNVEIESLTAFSQSTSPSIFQSTA
jgi:hypothetical protein